MHWKAMMDRDYIYAFDLGGKDVVVTIDRVQVGTLRNGKQSTKKPVAYFRGKEKGLPLNSTNCKSIAKLIGSNDTDDWIGKQITLYPTTTEMAGETVECVRVRPYLPKSNSKGAPEPEPSASAEDDGR